MNQRLRSEGTRTETTHTPAVDPPESAKRPKWKRTAEFLKWLVFNVGIAIIIPIVIAVPIRSEFEQTAKGGWTFLIGIPELAIACGILAWTAYRDVMDSGRWDGPVRDILHTLTILFGLSDFVAAYLTREYVLANCASMNGWLIPLGFMTVVSILISGVVSIGRGMRLGDS